MKIFCRKYILLVVLLFNCLIAYTQTFSPTLSSGNEFDIFQKSGGGGIAAFKTNYSSDVKGSQFFLPDWETGEVVSTKQESYRLGLEFIYDKVRQELFVRNKGSETVLTANKEEIHSFSLDDGSNGPLNFLSSKVFTGKNPIVFYQVLVLDSSKVSFYKLTSTRFVRADPTDMMKEKQGDVRDEFVDKYSYYLANQNGALKPVELKAKSIKKVLEEFRINGETYLREHSEPQDEKYFIEMIKSLNH
jgi:hypothetical protein